MCIHGHITYNLYRKMFVEENNIVTTVPIKKKLHIFITLII